MPCRPNRLTRDRIRVPRGFRARISVFTVVQSWAAAVGLVELHTEGLHRWILTLPPAITAVVECGMTCEVRYMRTIRVP